MNDYLSVIIPMGRPERALPTLKALEDQTIKPEKWEIIVVGAGVDRAAREFKGLPVISVCLKQRLIPSRTRIEGVKKASGDFYLFIDDDIEISRDFFENLLPLLRSENLGAIGARLPGRTGAYFERLTDLTNFWSQQDTQPGRRDWLYSAALAVSKKAYEAAGGFNSALEIGEDVDLTLKIGKNNFDVLYEPGLVAFHNHKRDSFAAMTAYFWKNGGHALFFLLQERRLRVFSLKRAFRGSLNNLRSNASLNQGRIRGFWRYAPWLWFNYFIYQVSMEWHYQAYLLKNDFYCSLKPENSSELFAVNAFNCFKRESRLKGLYYYLRACLG